MGKKILKRKELGELESSSFVIIINRSTDNFSLTLSSYVLVKSRPVRHFGPTWPEVPAAGASFPFRSPTWTWTSRALQNLPPCPARTLSFAGFPKASPVPSTSPRI